MSYQIRQTFLPHDSHTNVCGKSAESKQIIRSDQVSIDQGQVYKRVHRPWRELCKKSMIPHRQFLRQNSKQLQELLYQEDRFLIRMFFCTVKKSYISNLDGLLENSEQIMLLQHSKFK